MPTSGAPVTAFEIPAWLTDPGPSAHRWIRISARQTRCAACGTRAVAQWHGRVMYTQWRWRNLMWDSRESAFPACPPSYKRDNGVNPVVVVPS